MEYITISKTKIKLMLTRGDVEKYRFSGPDGAGGPFLSGFRRMLRDVRMKTGFDAGEGRVLVRYFYGADGGCEMYLTKLSGKAQAEEVRDLNGAYLYRCSEAGSERGAVYRFSSLSDLSKGCSRLLSGGYSGRSEAFFDPGGRRAFYLALESEEPALAEYGGALCAAGLYFFLREHFSLFARDAVRSLTGLF